MPTYLTQHGARRFSKELKHLVERERSKVVQEVAEAAAQGDRSENAEYIYGKKRLREIDRRIRFISQRLDDCTVVNLSEAPEDPKKVFFGAIATVEDEDGEPRRYQLVGPDEVDANVGLISYLSPLGKVLLRRSVGDVVTVQRPAGELEMTLTKIEYGGWLGAVPEREGT